MNRYLKIFILFFATELFIFSILLFGISFYFLNYGSKINYFNEEKIVEIPFGSSLRKVSEILESSNMIERKNEFYFYLRFGRLDAKKIQAGYYKFSGDLSHEHLVSSLLNGRDIAFRVTFKEGQTIKELAETLENVGLVSKDIFYETLAKTEVINFINPPTSVVEYFKQYNAGGIEGYLYPDTYFFSKRDNAEKIITIMHQKLQKVLDERIKAKLDEQKLSLHDLLTIASIVEKETAKEEERPVVASVYLNRVKLGMLLQADPTVIYGIKNYMGKISKKDLQTHHEYNTYTKKGLPLGPICAVSLNSIKAVLWPSETNYLFFVSRNDGSHEFCENLKCHNAAVKKWQIDYFKQKKVTASFNQKQ